MINLALKLFLGFFCIAAAGFGLLYGHLRWSEGVPAAVHPFFQTTVAARPLVIAHRGGAALFPENTLYAFEQSWKLGVDMLEMDVRETIDGALVLVHDRTVDRTTDGRGLVGEMTLEAVKKLNAGFRFSPDGGKTFPFRDRKIEVPTLDEVLTALPEANFVIELKHDSPSIEKSLCRLLREKKMTDRVIVASFSQTVLEEFRRECPDAATSAGPSEVTRFLALYKTGLGASFSPAMQALQTPEYVRGMQIVTREFVETARKLNLQIHVWTVNETADMQRLMDAGVDGIMTDHPDRLLTLLGRQKDF